MHDVYILDTIYLQVSIYLYFYLYRRVQVDTYQVVSCMVIIICERHQTILKLGMRNYHMTKNTSETGFE